MVQNTNAKEMKNNVKAQFRMQEAAPTVVLTGPSGSGKSYTLTVVLPESSNRLLARNVGMKQTTLINTKIMLFGNMLADNVVIRIKVKPFDPLLIKPELTETLIELIYTNRDELEDVEIDLDAVKSLLNPKNRAYHFFEYVQKHNKSGSTGCPELARLQETVRNIFDQITPGIREEVREKEKESKTVHPKPKKRELYDLVINRRLEDTGSRELEEAIFGWFRSLYDFVRNEILQTCIWLDSNEEYAVLSNRVESDEVQGLIQRTYDIDSPYSLVVEELSYLVQPAQSFMDAFNEDYRGEEHLGKALRLNILDTPGLTQVGEDRTHIEDALNHVFSLRYDAFLFLCSTDERPLVYDICKDLLISNKQKFQGIPMKMLRTKADLEIYEKMKKDHLIRVGRPEFQGNEALESADRAYTEFCSNLLEENESLEKSLRVAHPLDFVSLDFAQMKSLAGLFFEDKPMEKRKLFGILLELSRRVYEAHMPPLGGRRYLQVVDPTKPALVSDLGDIEQLLHAFAQFMVEQNTRDHQRNYYQYAFGKRAYHGRSVYTFTNKHRIGVGHETRAAVYENFSMHIRSMLQKWIVSFFQQHEIKFAISFDNIVMTEARLLSEIDAPEVLLQVFQQQKLQIFSRIAKSLSYDGLKKEMEMIYYKHAWDKAFRENVILFFNKFNDPAYWKETIKAYLKQEMDQILEKMYFYE